MRNATINLFIINDPHLRTRTNHELQMNRLPVNALTGELMVALRQAIETAPQQGIRMVLSGMLGRFSGGLDVPFLLALDRPSIAAAWRELYALLKTLAASPIPIAAAVTGHARVGGTVLPLFCDYRVMAAGDFKLGLNEVQVGLPLPPVILAVLQRLVGPRQAEHLAFSGVLISLQQALEVGVVDEIAAADQVIERAVEWCRGRLALTAEAMAVTRREARADLVAIFEPDIDPELQKVTAAWWHPEAQSTLRRLWRSWGRRSSSNVKSTVYILPQPSNRRALALGWLPVVLDMDFEAGREGGR
jgi:Delta3-Delta2-enoyl-CoA isomerase